ncbi:putative Zinc finger, RING-type [Septoria linicola]|nr:putative Zinc finger, RING-type [Septoria linicola]
MSSWLFIDWLNAGAQSLEIITLVVPNPEWHMQSSDSQPTRVNESLGFHFITTFNIRTLSSRGANHGNDVTGLLYVPSLDSADPCVNASAPHVPQNATRRANLPQKDYTLVALAPWVSGECSLKYMEAARQDPAHSIVFFLPGNDTGTPPEENDARWDIPNAGNWKSANGFPVYAVNGQIGSMLMDASAMYSGNMTDVPNGGQLVEYYDSKDYVRLYADIDTGNGTTLPSLWVFLLIVLGILLAIIGITSISMHWLQLRRRQTLRRRVQTGEVDLEALGIKRLTVPQDLLNSMPLYVYGSTTRGASTSASTGPAEFEKLDPSTSRPAMVPRSTSYRPSPLAQPTCAICLDDFVLASEGVEGTTVRELPCHHIFHPECVDTFLRDSSSLCPMCKKTALPAGYCPRVITNAMVRRERILRQMRERLGDDPDAANDALPQNFSQRIRSMPGVRQYRARRGLSTPPMTASQQMTQMETSSAPASAVVAPPSPPPPHPPQETSAGTQVQPPATADHRSWARQRAENMLGRRAPADPDAEEARRTPAWRKAVRSLFPRQ